MGLNNSAGYMGANSFHNQIETDRKILETQIRQWGTVNRLVMPGDFPVTPGAGHNVSIGAGQAYLPGRGLAIGTYFVYSDGADIVSLPAPDTNPFIATVIVRVADDQYGTVTGTVGARYDVIKGTPAASPTAVSDATIDALNIPGTWMRLCDVRVNVADTGVIPGGQFTTPVQKIAAAPSARMRSVTATTTVPNSAITKVNLDTVDYDTDGMTVLANSNMVIQTPGLYIVTGIAAMTANATGARGCHLYVNGAIIANSYVGMVTNAIAALTPVTTLQRMAAADVLDLRTWQNSGGTLTPGGLNNCPQLCAVWVAP